MGVLLHCSPLTISLPSYSDTKWVKAKVTEKVGEKEKEEVRVKENGKVGFLVAVISVQCVVLVVVAPRLETTLLQKKLAPMMYKSTSDSLIFLEVEEFSLQLVRC